MIDRASIHVEKAISPVALPGRTGQNKKSEFCRNCSRWKRRNLGKQKGRRNVDVQFWICFASKNESNVCFNLPKCWNIGFLIAENLSWDHLTQLRCSKCRKQVLRREQSYSHGDIWGLGSKVHQFRQISLWILMLSESSSTLEGTLAGEFRVYEYHSHYSCCFFKTKKGGVLGSCG